MTKAEEVCIKATMVTSSLATIQTPGHRIENYKMIYFLYERHSKGAMAVEFIISDWIHKYQ